MRTSSAAVVLGFAALTLAAPRPQDTDYALGNGGSPQPSITVPIGASTSIANYDTVAADEKRSASFWKALLRRTGSSKQQVEKRYAGNCAPLPSGYGPVPSPDTPTAFTSYSAFATAATNAPTPSNYVNSFTNLQAASIAYVNISSTSLTSYDPDACAALCNSHNGCAGFNIFYERDPTLDPGPGCTDPPSTTTIKCVLWGGPTTRDNAKNVGQTLSSFKLVIAGSNGYNKVFNTQVPGYTGPTSLGNAAIKAPTTDTFIGNFFYNDSTPFDPSRCAAACTARPNCKFFDTYLYNSNGIPKGQMCDLYTQTYDIRTRQTPDRTIP